jgi:hypothetical protein
MMKNLFLSLALSLLFIVFISCSSMPPVNQVSTGFVPKPIKVTYLASYDYTWQVTKAEMQRYPLKLVNKEAGSIETLPQVNISDKYQDRLKYYIDIKIKKLPDLNQIPQTEVEITKFVLTDPAIGMPKPVPSDLIEEKVIHHRIKRLLEIERKKLERI